MFRGTLCLRHGLGNAEILPGVTHAAPRIPAECSAGFGEMQARTDVQGFPERVDGKQRRRGEAGWTGLRTGGLYVGVCRSAGLCEWVGVSGCVGHGIKCVVYMDGAGRSQPGG